MKKTCVINFMGGPGAGKSTQAAALFATMKMLGFNVELITEYAKDLTWQESNKVLKNQLYVFAKQHHRMWRVSDSVDYIITDAPLIHSLVYGETSNTFKELVIEEFNKFENINVFLTRKFDYNVIGRSQNQVEANNLSNQILEKITALVGEDLHTLVSQDDTSLIIMRIINKRLNSYILT